MKYVKIIYHTSYVSEFHTSTTAPRAVAYATLFSNAIAIFMAIPAIIFFGWLDWTWDFQRWRAFIICISAMNLLNGLIYTMLPESPKFLLTINRKENALKVLQRVYAFNTGKPPEVRV